MNGSLELGVYAPTGHSGSFSYYSADGLVYGGSLPAEPVKLPASTTGLGRISIGPFRMKDAGDSYSLPQTLAGVKGVVHQPFSETLTFTEEQDVTQLWKLIRCPFGIAVLCVGGAGLIILELLRRMRKRVGTGEAFSSRNIQDMRRIAFTLIGSAILKAVALGWLMGAMANYAAQHAAEKYTFALARGKASGVWWQG